MPADRVSPLALGAAARTPPGAGAVVMGTGIVSIALSLDHRETPSRVLLVIAAVLWLGLAGVFCLRLIADRRGLVADARSPEGLTAVAATTVLGARFAQLRWPLLAVVLLGCGFVLWLPLTLFVVRCLAHEVTGEWFMLTVAAEGLASLAAMLAKEDHDAGLLGLAVGLAATGVLLYPLVLAQFDRRNLVCGEGEHWVAGGSLAISALSFAQAALAASRIRTLHGTSTPLEVTALVLWAAAMLWLPALVVAEFLRPRLAYRCRRWSTVFPLGMYAACSFAVAAATGAAAIRGFAAWWVWVAAVGWLAVFAGMVRHVGGAVREVLDKGSSTHR